MDNGKQMKVGIGFATGRGSFKKVLKTYIYNWEESGLTERENISLDLFIAYDLKYSNTTAANYTNVKKDLLGLVNEIHYLGNASIQEDIADLVRQAVIDPQEARLFFGSGYAAKRNAILFSAVKHGMDALLFLDDDEYPVAVTKTRKTAVWGGQQVLSTHLNNIRHADITNGYHCGYISPIPYLEFNERLSEADFQRFIEAISNDIVSWDAVRAVMNGGGVTYADTRVLTSDTAYEVPEIHRAKFITGANLCINLRDPDTFLSTCLSERTVLRVPCYAFHDGFSTYNHLLDGVLPIQLRYIKADAAPVVDRFYKACIGWIRYKPLLLYITQRDQYAGRIAEMRAQLSDTLPKLCAYFEREEFMNIAKELESYHRNVEKHYEQFLATQQIWKKLCAFLSSRQANPYQ